MINNAEIGHEKANKHQQEFVRRAFRWITAICWSFATVAALADGTLQNTTIAYINTQGRAMLIVPRTVNGAGLAGQPGCVQAAWRNILVADSSTADGRMNIAVALMAQAQERSVDVVGAGTCSTNGAAEDIRGILMR